MELSMTRKNYKVIAEWLTYMHNMLLNNNNIPRKEVVLYMTERVMSDLKQDNENFNNKKFLAFILKGIEYE